MKSKIEIRHTVLDRRQGQVDRPDLSRQIVGDLQTLNCWARAKQILFYVDIRSEVMTRSLLQEELAAGRNCIVPYCQGERLQLARIEAWDELTTGAFGVLEPKWELQHSPTRHIDPWTVDLVLVPGVAFDPHGGRLGYGRGYYDRLLRSVRADCHRIGLAFDCQIVDRVPMESHDEPVHLILTERRILDSRSAGHHRVDSLPSIFRAN